jgi:uncharacterized membrane protein
MIHRLLLVLHLLGTVAFFSNLIAALFWQARASRDRHPAVVAFAFRTLNAGDSWITPIAVATLLASGVGLALVSGRSILGTGWLLWSTAAFLGSGLVFVARVLPAQRRLARWTANEAAAGRLDRERYAWEARRWAHPAHSSLGLATIALLLMITKPDLPAF